MSAGLANELLADLEDFGDDDMNDNQSEASQDAPPKHGDNEADEDMLDLDANGEELVDLPEGGIRPADELDAEDVQQMEFGAIEDVTKIAKLEESKRMSDILKV